MSSPKFYHAFEERYRGPRDLIKRRLGVYLPFIEPLRRLYADCAAVDLGCGRGEWLELLQQHGFKAHGVDIDESMLAICMELSLAATREEATTHLKTLTDDSHCIISGFHLAEHISFDALEVLIAEALRVLKPGGLLILETPNPENIAVGTNNFYLDPTHIRPIPPLLLSFLPEYYGFERVKILRLQESPEAIAQENIALINVFSGVSPDYAIVAQKQAAPEILQSFNEPFDKAYGIDLHDLAHRYEAKLDGRMAALDQRLANAEAQAGGMRDALARISTLEDKLIAAMTQAERSEARATRLMEQLHYAELQAAEHEQRALATEAKFQEQKLRAAAAEVRINEQAQQAAAIEAQHEARANEQIQQIEAQYTTQVQRIEELSNNTHHWRLQASALEAERNALRQSYSWRITAPLRWVAGLAIVGLPALQRSANHSLHLSIATLHRPIALMMRAVFRRPRLRFWLSQRLMRYPALYQQLLGVGQKAGLISSTLSHASAPPSSTPTIPPDLAHLTPWARRIYRDLKTAIEKNRQENP